MVVEFLLDNLGELLSDPDAKYAGLLAGLLVLTFLYHLLHRFLRDGDASLAELGFNYFTLFVLRNHRLDVVRQIVVDQGSDRHGLVDSNVLNFAHPPFLLQICLGLEVLFDDLGPQLLQLQLSHVAEHLESCDCFLLNLVLDLSFDLRVLAETAEAAGVAD